MAYFLLGHLYVSWFCSQRDSISNCIIRLSSDFGGNWKLTRLKNLFLLFNTARWHCKVLLQQQCDSASPTLIKSIFNNNNNNNNNNNVFMWTVVRLTSNNASVSLCDDLTVDYCKHPGMDYGTNTTLIIKANKVLSSFSRFHDHRYLKLGLNK